MKVGSVSSSTGYSADYTTKSSSIDDQSNQVDTTAVVQKAAAVVQDKTAPVEGTKESSSAKDGHDIINDEMLKKAVAQANKSLIGYGKYIERDVHKITHAVMYQLRDSTTKEVIMEFPPKKIEDMIAKMWEMAGLVVDEKL